MMIDLTALPGLEHGARVERCRAELETLEVDALLITKPENRRWLVGFTGSAGYVYVSATRTLLVTDGRYRTQAAAELERCGVDAEVVISVTPQEVFADVSADANRVALEARHVCWADQVRYDTEWFPHAELVATDALLEGWRVVKDDGEVARMQAAAAVADAALGEVLHTLHDRPTEQEFALVLETAMRARGSSGVAFETIIASGPNSALPHARPTGRRIDRGDLVVIDFGAVVDGYRSDMTRTVCVGEPSEEQVRLHRVVGEAQAAGKDAVRAGVSVAAIDDAARTVIDQAGWGEEFVHGTGHGVGLEIHEPPHVGRATVATLQRRSVITVEPGVYLPGVGGVRTEDTVVVTDTGYRTLTNFPRDLCF